MKRVVCALWLLCCVTSVAAAEFRPFVRGSKPAIEQAHAGRPFILAFWSVDCTFCAEEVQHLRALTEAHPSIALVLVSTDVPEFSDQAAALLGKWLRSGQAERWMFAEDAEHLYFAVDRRWHGELPRAYFYDASGKVQVKAGKADPRWLADWARSLKPAQE